jgi:hypothetical protein
MTTRQARKAVRLRTRRVKNRGVAALARRLPSSVERLPIVRRTVEVLDDGAQRAKELGEARLGDLDIAFDRIHLDVLERIDAIEATAQKEAKRWYRRLQLPRLTKRFNALPRQLASRWDTVLDRLGLMRKKRHNELLARAKKRIAAARKMADAAA